MAEDNSNETGTDALEDNGKSFIAIEAIGRFSYGRELRLKTDDVFVAVDGDPIDWDIDKFDQMLSSHAKLPAHSLSSVKVNSLKFLSIDLWDAILNMLLMNRSRR